MGEGLRRVEQMLEKILSNVLPSGSESQHGQSLLPQETAGTERLEDNTKDAGNDQDELPNRGDIVGTTAVYTLLHVSLYIPYSNFSL
jgi:hypothetical protein